MVTLNTEHTLHWTRPLDWAQLLLSLRCCQLINKILHVFVRPSLWTPYTHVLLWVIEWTCSILSGSIWRVLAVLLAGPAPVWMYLFYFALQYKNCAMFDIARVTSVKTRGFLLFNQSVWRLKSSKNIPSAGLGWTGRGGPQKGGCRLAVAL